MIESALKVMKRGQTESCRKRGGGGGRGQGSKRRERDDFQLKTGEGGHRREREGERLAERGINQALKTEEKERVERRNEKETQSETLPCWETVKKKVREREQNSSERFRDVICKKRKRQNERP